MRRLLAPLRPRPADQLGTTLGTDTVHVILRLRLDLDADTVWAHLRSPETMTSLYAPAMVLRPVEAPLPARWATGSTAEVRLLIGGRIPAGHQRVDIRLRQRGDIRILEDTGEPTRGPLTVITRWRHRMAVQPTADGGTLYRDRLDIHAGALTPLLWIGFWGMWRWRGVRMRRLLHTTRTEHPA